MACRHPRGGGTAITARPCLFRRHRLEPDNMNKVKEILPVASSASRHHHLRADKQTKPHSGQELRFHPSTAQTALGRRLHSPAAPVASDRSPGADCVISATFCGSASSPWKPSPACSNSPPGPAEGFPRPMAPTASSPKSRCRWHPLTTGWTSSSAMTSSWTR